ncbi:MAG: cysteine hydrolase family protein [Candidatus Methylacidiphilales bacterium]|nr:cysteine hydrolase family protein [Candidatus Methylacidiphilales bacterium]
MKKALIVIDVQNDYFPGGHYPLWEVHPALATIVQTIHRARHTGIEVVLIQHIFRSASGPAPFFNEGTSGADLHPDILAAAPDAPVMVKAYADSFQDTGLAAYLDDREIGEILLCGMLTQNCVTHTALSKQAEKYATTVLADGCATSDKMVHLIALRSLSARVRVVNSCDVF